MKFNMPTLFNTAQWSGICTSECVAFFSYSWLDFQEKKISPKFIINTVQL